MPEPVKLEPVPTRFTLRQLPLPAKLVITLFLLTVGLGYSSAMVQLHFQHTQRDGNALPGSMDPVEIFAGKKWVTREEAEKSRPVSKLEKLVMGPTEGILTAATMAPAFFMRDECPDRDNNYKRLVKDATPEEKAKLDAEREGERVALQLWIKLPDDRRRAAYEADSLTPLASEAPKDITPLFLHAGGSAIKVKSILTTRCVECHQEGGRKSEFPLDRYENLAKYMQAPAGYVIPEGEEGAWCPSERQISKEKLAQSTHAHLLSFAMLFTLTGLVFAFTSYPAIVRGILGPLVLLAQVADISCWWLARLDGPGIYFAWAIVGTGSLVGLGLIAQIVLSSFNMYGPKGKVVVAGIFLGLLAAAGLTYVEVIKPELQAEKDRKAQTGANPARPAPEKKGDLPDGNGKAAPPPVQSESWFETLLTGTFDPKKKGPFGGSSMVRAFFDKDELVFLPAMEDQDPLLPTLIEERRGEQAVFLAWVKSQPEVRKKAYEEDSFPMPAELSGKPFTAEFIAGQKGVKVKTLINTRCTICHNPDGEQPDYPLTKFEELEKYFQPKPKE
jgi:hypothetical protein